MFYECCCGVGLCHFVSLYVHFDVILCHFVSFWCHFMSVVCAHFVSFYVTFHHFVSFCLILCHFTPSIPNILSFPFLSRMAADSPPVTTLCSATPPHPPNSSGSAKAPAKTNATPPTHSLLSCQLYLFPLANHPSRLKLSRKTPSQSPSWKHSAAAWLRDQACSPQPDTAMWLVVIVVVRMI